MTYVKQYAQETEDEIIRSHIALYVNAFTVDLGVSGRDAILQLLKIGQQKEIIPDVELPVFI